MNRFLAELKRRRVVRAALVYMGAAFVVLQVGDLFVEAFQLPPVVFATLGMAAIVGLPVTIVLSWAFDVGPPDPDSGDGGGDAGGRWFSGRSLLAILVLVGAGVLIGLAPRYFTPEPGESPGGTVRRYEILLPDHAPIEFIGSSPLSSATRAMAITPDGSRLIYAGSDKEHGTRLFVRDLSEFEVRPLAGTEGAYAPFISPDGETVGFFAKDQLRVVPIDGGDARIVAEAPNPLGGAWWGPERIIFNDQEANRHWWVPLIGATPTPLPIDQSGAPPGGTVAIGQEYHPLPDGARFLVSTSLGTVSAYSPATGELSPVMEIAVNVDVASDALVYAIANDLFAVAFDPASASLSGDEWAVGSGLRRDDSLAQFIVSDSTLIYATGAPYGHRRLALVGLDGSLEELDLPARRFQGATFSPDGRRLAIAVRENFVNIWLYDLESLERRKLTGGGDNFGPHWSADGSSLYFSSNRDGDRLTAAIYRIPADGGPGDAVRVFQPDAGLLIDHLHAGDVATMSKGSGNIDVFLVDLLNGEARPVASHPDYNELLASLSPDGRWLAMTVDATGRYEVVIQSVDGDKETRLQVTTEGGEEPRWAADMRTLFYRYGSRLYAVPVSFEEGRPVTGSPRTILEDERWRNIPGYSYWRNPADGRFLILRDVQPSTSRSLRVVEGWRHIGRAGGQ